jgi:predicted lipoprotein with Yx(FWY)xxD motif
MKNRSVYLSTLLGAAALAASATVFADSAPATFKGGVLVDSRGMTLYTFDKDPAGSGKSVCNAACAGVWPPFAAAAGSATGGDFAVITRDDGGKQLAHKGRPLYFYAPDQKPGDMTGDNSGGVWHVVRSEPAKASQKPAGGSPFGYGY